jgi:acyl transferase domain-containing protein
MLDMSNWHVAMVNATSQLVTFDHPTAVSFGVRDSIPASIIRESGLEVLKWRNAPLTSTTHTLRVDGKLPSIAVTPEASKPDDRSYPDHSVAVVGMACRFPGADSLEEFWELLASGGSMCQEMPSERFSTADLRRSPDGKLKFFGNFIRDADAFDHRFFKKSSREAASMDPQQRILLEVAYAAMESSGYFGTSDRDLAQDIGVYIGACSNDYNDNVASHNPTAFSSLGTLRAFLSGRISHWFDWTGPSITYDTACSSSAVAIDAACKAIQVGDCSQAIAGGVSLYTNPNFYQNLAAASFLSPTGPTKPFDSRADGYCRGEGIGLVVLKKLSAAVADGDNIIGVIAGSAVNQNRNCTYITVPHGGSQQNLYEKVARQAAIMPKDISYVEAHGTGTFAIIHML